jgi:uncharacterized protein YgiM (DUF1202 family)
MLLLLASAAAAQIRAGKTAYVSAKSLPIKSTTGFFAKTVGTLSYGDEVKVLSVNGKWAKIQSTAWITGWTAQTNLSTKRVTASRGNSASSREVAMAGKGFTEEVEKNYREGHQEADYQAVDQMEAYVVDDEELLKFIEEGRLSMGDE